MTHNQSQKSLAHQFWASQDWSLSNDELAMRLSKHKRTVRKWRSKLGHASPATNLYSAPFAHASSFPLPPPSPAFEPSPITQRSVREPEAPATPRRPQTLWSPPSVSDTIPAPSGGYDHRILFIPDCHVPYHDRVAFRTMLAAAQWWRPTAIVILGDFLDLYCVSSHPKKPSVRLSLSDEMDRGNEALDMVDALGVANKYYVMGNHEARLQKYIAKHAPMFDGLLSVEDMLRLDDRGWHVTPYGDGIDIGELYVTHDVGLAGQNAVYRSMMAVWQSIVIGHIHRMTVISVGDRRGRTRQGASFGCLADFDAIDYMHRRKVARCWRLGFGAVRMSDAGDARISGVPIENGACVVEGHVIRAEDYQWSRAA